MNITSPCAAVAAVTVVLCLGSTAPARAADETRVSASTCLALTSLQRRIVDKSDQGGDALRGFIVRTRSIYQLDMLDVAESLDTWRAAAKCAQQVADARLKQK